MFRMQLSNYTLYDEISGPETNVIAEALQSNKFHPSTSGPPLCEPVSLGQCMINFRGHWTLCLCVCVCYPVASKPFSIFPSPPPPLHSVPPVNHWII